MRLTPASHLLLWALTSAACGGAPAPVTDPATADSPTRTGASPNTTSEPAAVRAGSSAPPSAGAIKGTGQGGGGGGTANLANAGTAAAPISPPTPGAASPATVPRAGSTAPAPSAGAGAGAAGTPAAPAGSCGTTPQPEPFACNFAWGTNDPGGSLAAFNGLQFMSKWVGYELDSSGNLPRCDGCSWLREQVASSALAPVYYAYFIGYFGKANGLPDGNENPNGPNLTTGAAKLIRAQRPKLIGLYRDYAKQTAQAWPDKPLVWLLEGDFVQYTAESQQERLSLTELAELAQEISCAIKSEMPKAVVAINHSTWNSDEVTNSFWNALSQVSYDLVWTTGVANNNGFFEMGSNASSYNAATATYAYVHKLTGRGLFVDTSFGLSEMADSWSSADVATLNARIDEGVIAANVTKPPNGYVATATTLSAQLKPVCQ